MARQSGPKTPFVGVVVVTYNRQDVTNLMLDSLARAKNQTPYELFVLDNCSQRYEYERIARFFEYLRSGGLIRGKMIRSDTNLGFPGGNNVGIREFLGRADITHICLLNNDTIVGDYWIDDLVEASGNEMLVGPLSNHVGNEQVVPVSYRSLGCNKYTTDMVREYAANWRKTHRRWTAPAEMLGFFCVLGPIELYRKVGLLDEGFGVGTFEDDDYCARVLGMGLRLGIARHVFVHHWGSATFSRIPSLSLQTLTRRNQKRYERKHGAPWRDPMDTLPVALDQEKRAYKESGSEESLVPAEKISEMIRGQIRWLAKDYKETRERNLIEVIRFWLENRIAVRRGVWPNLVRHAAIFSTKVVLGSTELRKEAWKAFGNRVRSWRLELEDAIANNYIAEGALKPKLGSGQTVVIFPVCFYRGRVQRPQHIARGLAESGANVIWVDPARVERSLIGVDFLLREFTPMGKGSLTRVEIGQISYENQYVTGVAPCEARHLVSVLDQITGEGPRRVIIQSPFWSEVARLLHEPSFSQNHIIYDCMDDHIAFGSATREVEMLEEMVLRHSHEVVVSSEALHKTVISRLDGRSGRLLTIRNGAEISHFTKTRRVISVPEGKPIVGYFGAIAEWFDHEMVVEAAKRLPDYTFQLIGDFALSELRKMKLPENIELHGELPYKMLPELAAQWSAALIPFRLTPLIVATNPVKMYEYSALGLPIVCTALPEVLLSGLEVHVAKDGVSLARAIRDAIASDSSEKVARRIAFAEENAWPARVRSFAALLEMEGSDRRKGDSIASTYEGTDRRGGGRAHARGSVSEKPLRARRERHPSTV